MPYITVMQPIQAHQVSLEEILLGEVNLCAFAPQTKKVSGTITHFTETVSPRILSQVNVAELNAVLHAFNEKHKALFEAERHSLYETFPIPKKSGGLRTINAPHPELMAALRELKSLFEVAFHALYHTSAYAYIRNRSALDAVHAHQRNGSNWFFKSDAKDFFGSTTKEFLMAELGMVFPFSEVLKTEEGTRELDRALSLCTLDGGLPQGTPISPMLTNLMMIPIDHAIANELHKKGFVYTRFADDIQISSRYDFSPTEMTDYILGVWKKFHAPFQLSPKKTHYGSKAGQNWCLGVMLNKDNEITIGHARNKQFKAMCNNYIVDRLNHVQWSLHDLQVFDGHIAYYRGVNRQTTDYIISRYNEKYCVNMMMMLRLDIKDAGKAERGL